MPGKRKEIKYELPLRLAVGVAATYITALLIIGIAAVMISGGTLSRGDEGNVALLAALLGGAGGTVAAAWGLREGRFRLAALTAAVSAVVRLLVSLAIPTAAAPDGQGLAVTAALFVGALAAGAAGFGKKHRRK